jgi:L-threonylcarbamoyladenylate synthase
VAVRVTAHPLAAALCRAVGAPVVSTSANRSGQPPLQTALAVRCQLGDRLDYILGGTVGRPGQPTGIRDGISGNWIRQP